MDKLNEFEDKTKTVIINLGEECTSNFKVEDKFDDGNVYIGD